MGKHVLAGVITGHGLYKQRHGGYLKPPQNRKIGEWKMKTEWSILLGGLIGIFSQIFGGFDNLFAGLLVIMIVDYVTGIIAALLGKSGKTKNGHLSSKAGFKGILKKITMLLFVCMAKYAGEMFNIKGLRDMVITFFAVNDCISILENGGRIGVKYPEKLKNILEDLLEREE